MKAKYARNIKTTNPGQLVGGLTVKRLLDGDYTSAIRNKQIAAMFKEAGFFERYGSGIRRILESFANHGLESPVFEEIQNGFRVTVYLAPQKTTQKTKDKISTKDKIISLLRAHPNLTRAALALELSK